jgi:hypothetical protein
MKLFLQSYNIFFFTKLLYLIFKKWNVAILKRVIWCHTIQANYQGTSELYSILMLIKLLLQCNANFEIKFSNQQANMAADTLARAAISWSSRTFFNSIFFFCFSTDFRPIKGERLIRFVCRDMRTGQVLFPWKSNSVFPRYFFDSISFCIEHDINNEMS